ncbi:beta-glucan-binding protein, partial [Trifolium medium]|nr:beta-glucan-binding protein [Trifolium medium]
IRDGVGGVGWFGESVSKKVGGGIDTLFWIDLWLGGIPLCVRFRRLFDLAEDKSGTIAEMSSLGWEAGGEAWAWGRQLPSLQIGGSGSLILKKATQLGRVSASDFSGLGYLG